jgi:hypothetical protein
VERAEAHGRVGAGRAGADRDGDPAVLALTIVAAVGLVLVGYETVAYADYRDRVRHG